MTIPGHLAAGEHLLIEQPVIRWNANASATVITLTASIQSGPIPPISQALGATSVALRMDRLVAMQLHAKLGELARSMGWPPLQADDPPA